MSEKKFRIKRNAPKMDGTEGATIFFGSIGVGQIYHSNHAQEAIESFHCLLSEYDIFEDEMKRLQLENKKLKKALDNLVNLKIHKETFGKTEYYEEYKEVAWNEAKEILGFPISQ